MHDAPTLHTSSLHPYCAVHSIIYIYTYRRFRVDCFIILQSSSKAIRVVNLWKQYWHTLSWGEGHSWNMQVHEKWQKKILSVGCRWKYVRELWDCVVVRFVLWTFSLWRCQYTSLYCGGTVFVYFCNQLPPYPVLRVCCFYSWTSHITSCYLFYIFNKISAYISYVPLRSQIQAFSTSLF